LTVRFALKLTNHGVGDSPQVGGAVLTEGANPTVKVRAPDQDLTSHPVAGKRMLRVSEEIAEGADRQPGIPGQGFEGQKGVKGN
jgi:hypothetical protein